MESGIVRVVVVKAARRKIINFRGLVICTCRHINICFRCKMNFHHVSLIFRDKLHLKILINTRL